MFEQNDTNEDVCLEILNDIHGHLDFSQMCKYHDLISYDKLTSSKSNQLNLLHMNPMSIQNKKDSISAIFKTLKRPPDVLCITESWLKESNANFCNIPNYSAYHVCRKTRLHGGVSIFVANHLQVSQLSNLSFIHHDIEINTICITYPTTSYIICTIYRPHSKTERVDNFTSILSEILCMNELKNKKVILIGDLNIDLLQHHNDAPTGNFLSTMQTLNFFIHISRATRFPIGNQTGEPALLDHIFTNFHNSFKTGILHYDISDHLPVFINIPLPSRVNSDSFSLTSKKQYRLHSMANKAKFSELLSNTNWDNILDTNDVNTNTEKVIKHVMDLYNDSFPLKTKFISQKRSQNPWITNAVLNSIKNKNKLFKDFKVGAISFEEYRIFRNTLNKVVRSAKQTHYINYFNEFRNSTKNIWLKIKELQNNNSVPKPQSILVDGKLSNNKYDIANEFNKFYSKIAPELNEKLPASEIDPLSFLRGDFNQSMMVPHVLIQDTVKIIKSLKDKNDPNFIPTSIIKANDSKFAIPLTILFNQSISLGVFPDCFKNAAIIPLYKKGPRDLVENYRPISILPVLSKIFEKLMQKFLVDYLTSKNILSSNQFGFRKGLSTFDALNSITTDIFSALDNHNSAIGVFVDFQKAFDTVPHDLLLRKLEYYGIRGCILNWFKSYLSSRSQRTIYDKCLSLPLTVTHGVPQGSILGPILFLVYINDLSNVFKKFKVVLFADDSSFYIIGNNIDSLIIAANSELDKFYEWTLSNRLSIHLDKTKFILFSNKKTKNTLPLFLNFDIIEQVDYHKVLGLTLDSNISFKQHINEVCNKIARSISMLFNLKDYMPMHVLKTIYYSHVHPHLNYCLPIWGSTYPTHLQSVFLLQKRAIRLVTNKPFLEHTNPLFKSSNIIKFFDLVKLEIGSFMFKNNELPIFNRLVHNYNTRHRNNLIPPTHDLSLFKRSILYMGPHTWNLISNNIKNKSSLRPFRIAYKKHLLSQY